MSRENSQYLKLLSELTYKNQSPASSYTNKDITGEQSEKKNEDLDPKMHNIPEKSLSDTDSSKDEYRDKIAYREHEKNHKILELIESRTSELEISKGEVNESCNTIICESQIVDLNGEEEIQESLKSTIERSDKSFSALQDKPIFEIAHSIVIAPYTDKPTTYLKARQFPDVVDTSSDSALPLLESVVLTSLPKEPNLSHSEISVPSPFLSDSLSISAPFKTDRVYHKESIDQISVYPPIIAQETTFKISCGHCYTISYLQQYLSISYLASPQSSSIKCPDPDCFTTIDKVYLMKQLLKTSPFTVITCPNQLCFSYCIVPKHCIQFYCKDCNKSYSISTC